MSANQKIRDAVAEARKTPGKEPFDMKKFRALYDVTIDIGDATLTMKHAEDYEEQYYLFATNTKTLAEFAEYRRRLGDYDAG